MTKLQKRIRTLVDHAKDSADNVVAEARSTAAKIAQKAKAEGRAAEAEFDRVSKVAGKKLKGVTNRI